MTDPGPVHPATAPPGRQALPRRDDGAHRPAGMRRGSPFVAACLALSCCGVLLLRPLAIADGDLIYPGDDNDYLAHATAVAFGEFPDYTRENNATFPVFRPLGPGLLAAPFVAAFSVLDRIAANPVIGVRTAATLRGSWTAFGFALATQCYLLLALYLLSLACREVGAGAAAGWALTLTVLGTGLPLYAYRRPVFSHVYEVFALSVALLLLVRWRRAPGPAPWQRLLGGLGCAALICLVRPNDAPLALALGAALALPTAGAPTAPGEGRRADRLRLAGTAAAVPLVAALALALPRVIGRDGSPPPPAANAGAALATLTAWGDLGDLGLRLPGLLIGLGWGLVFTAPVILIGLWGYWALAARGWRLWAPPAALAANLYVTLAWGTQGGWYGYRYLVFAALPFAAVGLAAWLADRGAAARTALAVWTFVPVLLMLAFERVSGLALAAGPLPVWVNDRYVAEVLAALVGDPGGFAVAVLRDGPACLAYLAAGAVGAERWLPAAVTGLYGALPAPVSARALLLWALPLLAGGAAWLVRRRRDR